GGGARLRHARDRPGVGRIGAVTAAAQAPALMHAAAELRRNECSVRVATGPGAPVTSFVTGGFEWCGAGAWTDYAPTLVACALPSYVAGAPRGAFPGGGTL